MLNLFDIDKLPQALFTIGEGAAAQAQRGEEAEALVGNWILDCGLPLDVPKTQQRGFDLESYRKIQVKQRTTKKHTGGGYVIDGLWRKNYDAGLVEMFVIIENLAPQYTLNRILIVDAVHVFNHPKFYKSDYNHGRGQLTAKRFEDLCLQHGKIYDLGNQIRRRFV